MLKEPIPAGPQFDIIFAHVFKDQTNVTVKHSLQESVAEFEYHSATEKVPAIGRRLTVSGLYINGVFKVKFEEFCLDPNFTMRSEEKTFNINNESDDELGWAQRWVWALVNEEFKWERIPLKSHLAKRDEINKQWLDSDDCYVELYMDSGTPRIEKWRFRIVHNNGQTICYTLNPNTADGHTYHMLVDSVKKSFGRGRKEGLMVATEKLVKDVVNKFHDGEGYRDWEHPEELQKLLKDGSFRKEPPVI